MKHQHNKHQIQDLPWHKPGQENSDGDILRYIAVNSTDQQAFVIFLEILNKWNKGTCLTKDDATRAALSFIDYWW